MRANAEEREDSDEVADLPKVEDKLGAVPNGLSTDSEVTKRFAFSFEPYNFFVSGSLMLV